MSNNYGINPHCLNKYSGEKPLIGKDDNRAIGCVDLASQMGYIIPKNYASAFGKHIFKLYRQKEKGIQWTYDLSRDNKGGYPVKGYELTNELRDAVRDYCESRSFEHKE